MNNITAWCNVCGNTVNTGCDLVATIALEKAQLVAANATIASYNSSGSSSSGVSTVGAGFIGAAVTIFVGALILGIGMGLGFVKIGKKDRSRGWNKRDGEDKGMVLGDSASFASTAPHHDSRGY